MSVAPSVSPTDEAPDGTVVSVVMPVHESIEFLDAAVGSVLMQDLPHGVQLELLLVDDGSKALEVHVTLDRLARAHPQVRVLRLPRNAGVSAARNAGIAAARGRYLAFLDSDDLWWPRRVAGHLDAMAAHDAALAGSDYDGANADGTVHTRGHFRRHPRKGRALAGAFASGAPTVYSHAVAMFIDCAPLWTGVVTIDRALMPPGAVHFDESLRQAEDVHLWIRLAALGRFVFLPESTAAYRHNAASLSRVGSIPQRDRWYVAALQDLRQGPLGGSHGAALRRRQAEALCDLAYAARHAGQPQAALVSALRALTLDPSRPSAWREALRGILGGATALMRNRP